MQMNPFHKKLLISLVVIGIGILSYMSVIDNLFRKPFIGGLDERGSTYFTKTMKRSMYAFAIVRGINGLISVIQGTSVAVSPAGVGVQLALGEILDPVNDLMERFSWVMLVSAASLGIQKLLMEIAAWLGFKVLLSFSILLIFVGIWTADVAKVNLVAWGCKLILVSIVIRFCIPSVAIVSEKIYDLFLKKTYAESVESLEKASREIKDITLVREADEGETNTGTRGYLDTLKKLYKNTADIVGIKAKLLFLKDKLSDYAKHITRLIIVFLLQTVIIPVLVLWGLARLAAHLWLMDPENLAIWSRRTGDRNLETGHPNDVLQS